MTDSDAGDHRSDARLAVHGRRTRVAAAIMGCLFSLGVPIAALSSPTLTVDQQPARPPADPAGLGLTGALSGDPSATEASPATGVPVDGVSSDSAGTALPGIPTPPNLPDGPLGIPGVMLDAYQFAERTLAVIRPGCHLSWAVLAGIGRIESDHASGGRVDAFGNTLGPILGPRLDGSPGVEAVADTDHGVLDGDTVWDRAVGPMQFIPSTWRLYGVDGNGDGVSNPNNIYDATVSTGLDLCAAGIDLSDPAQLQAAVFGYNHSATYVDIVLLWAHAYLTGVVPTQSEPGPVPPGTNGNGGRVIAPDNAVLAAGPPAAIPQATPAASTPSQASPNPTPTASPPATANSPAPTPTPIPVTTPPPTPLPTTTTPPPTATSVEPSPSPASTTTPPAQPAPSPPLPTSNPVPSPTPTATPRP